MTDTELGWAPKVLADVGEADEDFYIIGIRETVEPESWSMVFMECVDADDEQEIRLGMDTYCIVVDPGQATHYGGVLACEVNGTELNLHLSDQAARTLGVPPQMRLALSFDVEKVHMLRRGLARVLTSGRADAIPPRLAV